jgi:hypothetical protein
MRRARRSGAHRCKQRPWSSVGPTTWIVETAAGVVDAARPWREGDEGIILKCDSRIRRRPPVPGCQRPVFRPGLRDLRCSGFQHDASHHPRTSR